MQEKTFGQKYIELKSKIISPAETLDAKPELLDNYYRDFIRALNRGCAQFYGDFFINVRVKQELLFDNMPRYYFIPRETAPYPVTNTRLYHYDAKKDDIDIWWILPKPEDVIKSLMNSSNRFSLDKATLEEYKSCFLFADGSLNKKVKQYNDAITKSRLRPNFNPADYDYGDLVIAK